MHSRVQYRTSRFIPGHTNLAVHSRCVARIPGCARLCSKSKMLRRRFEGTNGQALPVDMSQHTDPVGSANHCSFKVLVEEVSRRFNSPSLR